ncbi:MAG: hypothetical protein QG649_186 [Patescibacteria group bacterium]|jgi:hypothetical protein|nr:hypothetical protein [Patescibacteria group bacterium]
MNRLNRLGRRAWVFVSSKQFFIFILTLAALQGIWYAVSFTPWVNDESKHFRTTQIFTEQLSPYVSDQPREWDDAGQVIRGGSYLFYYLYSWPLRAVENITDDTRLQLIMLRLSMIVLFIAALVIYRRALLLVKGLSPGLVHIALGVFVLTPAAGLLAGMYNYDNLALLLFAVAMYCSLRIVTQPKPRADLLLALLITGAFMVVIKWSSVALMMPLILSVIGFEVYRHRKKYGSRLAASFGNLRRVWQVTFVVGLLVGTALVVERPIQIY